MPVIWPLPALLSWGLGWALFGAVRAAGAPLMLAIAAGAAAGAACSVVGGTPWRRVFIVLGFPLSLAASGLAGGMPAWGWLLPLAFLALVYPINAWRDAPMFPTPSGALLGLAALVTKQEVLLVIVGGIFVIETISVILQVLWFKLTGRRILKCSPLHNHYLFAGHHEIKIVVRFWISSALLALIAVASLKIR